MNETIGPVAVAGIILVFAAIFVLSIRKGTEKTSA
jgi:hypothetical protein